MSGGRHRPGETAVLRFLIAAILSIFAAPALAADPAGCWALRAGDAALMLFDVARTPTGWTGIWRRPEHFTSDGDTFSSVTGPVIYRLAKTAREVADGVELTFDDPAPGAIPDVFVIRADSDAAELSYIAFGSEPATLTRVTCTTKLGGWEVSRIYVRTTNRPTDAEMTAIFEADQAARSSSQSIDWEAVSTADRKRRARAQLLLDAGRLRSADDFYHAAFVFQHGDGSGDYLKAHALAVIAAARGKPAATWIAAATLDRYLQSIGQPQIYGTQFSNVNGSWTQAPYRQSLLSDSVRAATRVPPLSEQEKQRLEYEKQDTEKGQ
jgi:hypothetical protein